MNFIVDPFIHVVFISWKFRWNICKLLFLLVFLGTFISIFFKHNRYVVIHVRVLNFVDYHFIHVVFISQYFRWNLCEFLFFLVCLGTCISKFFKHGIDVIVHVRYLVIHGFHIRVIFLVRVFYVSVNFSRLGFVR